MKSLEEMQKEIEILKDVYITQLEERVKEQGEVIQNLRKANKEIGVALTKFEERERGLNEPRT